MFQNNHHATQKRIFQKDNFPKHQIRDEKGEATETGNCNRIVNSGTCEEESKKALTMPSEIPMNLTPEQAAEILGLADIDRQAFESDFMAQRAADKNETDKVLIDKISIVLEVIECVAIDEIERGIAQKKLLELIGRL